MTSLAQTVGQYKRAAATQWRVILALFLRETRTRFGSKRLGILWVALEPIGHIAVFAFLGLFFQRMAPYSIPYTLFLISGILPFLLFRQAYSRTINAVNANNALLVFPQITFMDLTLSRVLLELFSITLAFALILGCYAWFVEPFHINNIPQAIFTYTLFPLMGMSLGLFMRPLIAVIPTLDSIISFMMRILYFASGTIIALERLPQTVLDFLRYNPLAHALEIFRGALFSEFWIMPGFDAWLYVVMWIIALFGFSGMLERRFNRWIVNRSND